MTISKSKLFNYLLILLIALLIIPQTRKPIQVLINKAIVFVVSPSTLDVSDQTRIANYNWKLKNLYGKTVNFNDFKGKVIVVNFWATWCPPCIAEMPSLDKLYHTYKSNDEVIFLYVSNEKDEVLKRFIKKKNFSFEVFQPITAYPDEFDVTSIPRTFIIDQKGSIIVDKTGPADWSSDSVLTTIDALLKAF